MSSRLPLRKKLLWHESMPLKKTVLTLRPIIIEPRSNQDQINPDRIESNIIIYLLGLRSVRSTRTGLALIGWQFVSERNAPSESDQKTQTKQYNPPILILLHLLTIQNLPTHKTRTKRKQFCQHSIEQYNKTKQNIKSQHKHKRNATQYENKTIQNKTYHHKSPNDILNQPTDRPTDQ